jgi:hypothetical protein
VSHQKVFDHAVTLTLASGKSRVMSAIRSNGSQDTACDLLQFSGTIDFRNPA